MPIGINDVCLFPPEPNKNDVRLGQLCSQILPWIPKFPDSVQRVARRDDGSAASEPLEQPAPAVLFIEWLSRFADQVPRPAIRVAAIPFVAFAPAPERTSPLADVRFPDRIDRPSLRAERQLAVTVEIAVFR